MPAYLEGWPLEPNQYDVVWLLVGVSRMEVPPGKHGHKSESVEWLRDVKGFRLGPLVRGYGGSSLGGFDTHGVWQRGWLQGVKEIPLPP